MSFDGRRAIGRNPLISEAIKHPILAVDEERELARRAEAGDPEALGRLVGSHLRFVIKIARAYRGWGLPMSDLIQEGTLGLIQAVRRFDPDRSVRLSTYAMWWIRSATQDYVVRSWSVVQIGTTNAQKALALKLKRTTDQRVNADDEWSDDLTTRLAKRFGLAAADVAKLARRVTLRDRSLDRLTAAGKDLFDRLASDLPSPEQIVARVNDQRVMSEMLNAALARLPPREQLVIRACYFEEARHTFEAIGQELGLSKDRVCQLEARALTQLRALLAPVLAGSRS